MTRILQINVVYRFGSTGSIVEEIHSFLMKNHMDSYVIYGRDGAIGNKYKNIEEKNVFHIESPVEEKEDILLSLLTDSHGLHSVNNTKKIIDKIREVNPDLIHLHNIHGFYLNYPMLFQFLKEYRKPVVWTLHDCWSYTGFCSYYDYNQCQKWKQECRVCRFRNVYPYRGLISNSHRNCLKKKESYQDMNMVLVTPSNWLREQVKQSILSMYPVFVIHNTLDLKDFYEEKSGLREQYHLESQRIYLGVASIWTNSKGYQEYLKLADMLNENETIVLIGVSERQRKKLPKNILGLPRCNAEELRKWYSLCDCFVNLTLEEVFGLVNLEARTCGAPVVTYHTGGAPESAGPDGMIAEKYNLNQVLAYARRAQRRDEKANLPKEDMREEYLKLYKRILGDNF